MARSILSPVAFLTASLPRVNLWLSVEIKSNASDRFPSLRPNQQTFILSDPPFSFLFLFFANSLEMSVGAFSSVHWSVNFPSLGVVKSSGQVCRFHTTWWNIVCPGVRSRPAQSTPRGETKSASSGTAALAHVHSQTPMSYSHVCREQRGYSQAWTSSSHSLEWSWNELGLWPLDQFSKITETYFPP